MTASLPMYQFHGTAKANDAWWAGVRQELVARGMENPPQDLLKVDDRVVHWSDPELVLSQTCGYPLLYALGAKVHLVATPCYDAPGCDGHNYSSVLLVRDDDTREGLESFRGSRLAFNGEDSQSGYNCLRFMLAPLARQGRFFSSTSRTGGHVPSMFAVAEGEADLCAVDCLTWALAVDCNEAPTNLRVLTNSPPAPCLPYITSAERSMEEVQLIRDALNAACANAALAATRSTLRLSRFEVLERGAYQVMADMYDDARDAGFPVLA